MKMKLAIGGDHAGFEYKQQLLDLLAGQEYQVEDFGTYNGDSVDYPDFAHPVASFVESNPGSKGILVCGSGNGVAMAANKHDGVRAAVCWNEDLAKLARQHNDANIICIPSRFVSPQMAKSMAQLFLSTEFEGGRHEKRVTKISC